MRFSVTLFKVFISPHHQPNAFLAFGWIDNSIDLEPARDRMFVSILEYRDRMFTSTLEYSVLPYGSQVRQTVNNICCIKNRTSLVIASGIKWQRQHYMGGL